MTFDAGTWWLAVLLLGFVTAGLVYLLKRSLFGRIDKLDESMKEISENSVKKSDYSKIASLCIAKERAGYEYTPTESDILKKLYYDIAAVQDVVGDETPLVITMARPVAAILDMSSTLSKSLSVMDFKQGDVTVKVKSLNGEFPIIRVGSGRMKTSYQFYDGTTSTQEKGGFVAADDAQDINWIICPRTSPIAVSRTDKVRIFDPETYQKKRAWATDYRKYHDLRVPDNKLTAMWVNIKQAKAGVGS